MRHSLARNAAAFHDAEVAMLFAVFEAWVDRRLDTTA
jgi:hypothetical protein